MYVMYAVCVSAQVQSLRKVCVEQIMDDITRETVLTYAVTADSLSDASLLEACLAFIKDPNNRYGKVRHPISATGTLTKCDSSRDFVCLAMLRP